MKLLLGGYLRFFEPKKQGSITVRLEGPAQLKDVLSSLRVPVSEVYLAVVNGEQVSLGEAVINDSDDVRLYPPIDGG